MPYDLEKMNSVKSLEKILLVIDDVQDKSEISGLSSTVYLRHDRFLDNVPKGDYKSIISTLLEWKILKDYKEVRYQFAEGSDHGDSIIEEVWEEYVVNIDQNKFDEFYNKLTNRIKELKGERMEDYYYNFDPVKAILYINSKEIKVQKFSDQHHLLRIIFEDKEGLFKDWLFSEIAEKYDHADKTLPDKKFYNAVRQLNQKITIETHLANFFITKNQSFHINSEYINKP
jgi:hypothetical protein